MNRVSIARDIADYHPLLESPLAAARASTLQAPHIPKMERSCSQDLLAHDLPQELWEKVVVHLGARPAARLACVNRSTRRAYLANHDSRPLPPENFGPLALPEMMRLNCEELSRCDVEASLEDRRAAERGASCCVFSGLAAGCGGGWYHLATVADQVPFMAFDLFGAPLLGAVAGAFVASLLSCWESWDRSGSLSQRRSQKAREINRLLQQLQPEVVAARGRLNAAAAEGAEGAESDQSMVSEYEHQIQLYGLKGRIVFATTRNRPDLLLGLPPGCLRHVLEPEQLADVFIAAFKRGDKRAMKQVVEHEGLGLEQTTPHGRVRDLLDEALNS